MKFITPRDTTYLESMARAQVQMAKETEDFALDPKKVTRGIEKMIEMPDAGEYLLAIEEGKLVGMLLLLKEWSDWRCQTVLWIHSVYIVPEKRGQGIYKQMYEQVKQKVLENDDLAGIRLYVDKTNKTAQKVYCKLGMNDEHYSLFEWLKP